MKKYLKNILFEITIITLVVFLTGCSSGIVKNVDIELDFQEENVHIIDFYKEIKEHKEYLLKDKVHLSEEGNKALISSLKEELGVK